MIITEEAIKALNAVLEEQNKKDHYLRVLIGGMGCCGPTFGLSLDDDIKETDIKTEVSGVRVVYDAELEQAVENVTIDYIDNEYGQGFIVEDPEAHSGCSGCAGCH
ncbi:iron-sulfur cluster assembly accessory protein [Methanosarcinaceae archaeon]|nr:iron-sulfur cluster assembly accessory protein [Methanosarcinaceae archaeon]MBQ3621163.1 iron-sulfur cluster assembly accessory protein [Methanosarcinaceae archaeon]